MPKIVDHEQQRRELSATVAQVVASEGLESTTLRAVAARHGCTKGMVQHYFADKEELLMGALACVEDACEARMLDVSPELTGLALLQAQLQVQLPLKDCIVQEWRVRLAFNSRAAFSAEMREVLSERYAQRQRAGVANLRVAQKAGDIRSGLNLRNTYRSLVALVFGVGVGAVMDPAQLPTGAQRQILKTAIDDLRR